jgi:hypothetical protein
VAGVLEELCVSTWVHFQRQLFSFCLNDSKSPTTRRRISSSHHPMASSLVTLSLRNDSTPYEAVIIGLPSCITCTSTPPSVSSRANSPSCPPMHLFPLPHTPSEFWKAPPATLSCTRSHRTHALLHPRDTPPSIIRLSQLHVRLSGLGGFDLDDVAVKNAARHGPGSNVPHSPQARTAGRASPSALLFFCFSRSSSPARDIGAASRRFHGSHLGIAEKRGKLPPAAEWLGEPLAGAAFLWSVFSALRNVGVT